MRVLDANTLASVRPGTVHRSCDSNEMIVVSKCDGVTVTFRYEEDHTNMLYALDIDTFVRKYS